MRLARMLSARLAPSPGAGGGGGGWPPSGGGIRRSGPCIGWRGGGPAGGPGAAASGSGAAGPSAPSSSSSASGASSSGGASMPSGTGASSAGPKSIPTARASSSILAMQACKSTSGKVPPLCHSKPFGNSPHRRRHGGKRCKWSRASLIVSERRCSHAGHHQMRCPLVSGARRSQCGQMLFTPGGKRPCL